MAKISKVKSVKVWTTTDGKTFDNFEKAQANQAALWFRDRVEGIEAVAEEIVAAIAADRAGFAADVGPVYAQPRKPRATKAAATGGRKRQQTGEAA